MAFKHSILFLLAALLSVPSCIAIDGNFLEIDPIGVPKVIQAIQPTPTVFSNNEPPHLSNSESTLSTATKPTYTAKASPGQPSTTDKGAIAWSQQERERREKHNSDVMIGGLMILIVGLLGPVVLYCWIRRRRRQEEAEFAAYVAANPQYGQSSQQSPPRRHGMEMRNMSVHRPVSPSGVPPPPTYQEAIASGRIPEQPK